MLNSFDSNLLEHIIVNVNENTELVNIQEPKCGKYICYFIVCSFFFVMIISIIVLVVFFE